MKKEFDEIQKELSDNDLLINNKHKKINILVEFVNKSVKDNTYRYKINGNSFKSFIRNFYENDFGEKLRLVTKDEVSFERVFRDKEDIQMDINDKIYLSVMLLKEINKTAYRNLIDDKELRLHFDFIEKYYSIAMPHSKRLCRNEMSYNIFAWIFDYFEAEIDNYARLSEKDKLIRISSKYNVKVDFTKRKHSYAYSSNHIVLSETVNFEGILSFFEIENTIYTENILKYFAFYVIDKESILDRLFREDFSRAFSYYKQQKKKVSIETKVRNLLRDLRVPEPKYMINKLKQINNTMIDKIQFKGKEYVVFLMICNEENLDCINILDFRCDSYELIFNYTNNHVLYDGKEKTNSIFEYVKEKYKEFYNVQ